MSGFDKEDQLFLLYTPSRLTVGWMSRPLIYLDFDSLLSVSIYSITVVGKKMKDIETYAFVTFPKTPPPQWCSLISPSTRNRVTLSHSTFLLVELPWSCRPISPKVFQWLPLRTKNAETLKALAR